MRGARTWHRLRASAVARKVVRHRLTYLSFEKLRTLERCARAVKREGVPGDFLEAGVALGGSAIVMSKALDGEREYHGYDVFGQIPPPSEHDDEATHERYGQIARGESAGIGTDTYYGYLPDLKQRVARSLEDFDVGGRTTLYEGLFEDVLWPPDPVALAHIDCDWYEPVKLCLERLGAAMSPGGFVVLDDYHDYEGCARATDEYLASNPRVDVAADAGSLVLRFGSA